MKKEFLSLALGALTLSACSSSDSDPENESKLEICPVEKVELTQEQMAFVSKSSEFAFQLAEKAVNEKPDDNLIISPISAAYVLGMIENGADGETKRQIASTLGFGDGDDEALNDFFHRLMVGAPRVDTNVKISIANAIIADKKFPLMSNYVDAVSNNYEAKVDNYDFKNSDMVGIINNWAKDHTNGMIDKVIDNVSPDDCMFAMNAVYFLGNWATPFEKSRTKSEDFTDENGNKQKVQMMHLNQMLGYGSFEDFSLVTLPYSNKGWQMNVLLPKEGKTISDVMASLSNGSWEKTLYTIQQPYNVDLALPKFEINSSIPMKGMLKDMGIVDAFDPFKANFTLLSEVPSFLSFILQKAKIEVDEAGTEAAAVTIGGFALTYSPVPQGPVEFHANRPFVFVITETTTGTIYFIGVKRN